MAIIKQPNVEPIPGYRLIAPLGRGGFGEVWKCEAPGGLFKAIKFVYGNLENVERESMQAHEELRAIQCIKDIRHPFLLSIDRVESIAGELVIVTELAEKNLHEVLVEYRQQGLEGLPRVELLRYLSEVAEVLDLMNGQHGLQHLDIKPRNLFVVSSHVKVGDFGLVTDLAASTADGKLGAVTPLYAAPEVFQGRVSRSSDQYSLACCFMELLTGKLPFDGRNSRQLLMQHLQDDPNLAPLSDADRPIVARALSKAPLERYESCVEFIRTLRGKFSLSGEEVVNFAPMPRRLGGESAARPLATATDREALVHTPSGKKGDTEPRATRLAPPVPAGLPGYGFVRSQGSSPLADVWQVMAPDGRQRQLKFIYGFAGRAEEAVRRLRALQHPALQPIEVVQNTPGCLVVVNDLARETVRERWQKCQAQKLPGIPRLELLAYLRTVAEATDYLYEQHSIQHLALNPRNLLLAAEGLQIAEFGLAHLFWVPGGQAVAQRNARYASPELFERQVHRSADQYSLALLFHELLTGAYAFHGQARAAVGSRLAKQPDLTALEAADRAIVARALEPDPHKRWASCTDLIRALEDAVGNDPPSTMVGDAFTDIIGMPQEYAADDDLSAAPEALNEIIGELITQAGGDVSTAGETGPPTISRAGDVLVHKFRAGLPVGAARVKLDAFRCQCNGRLVRDDECNYEFEVPTPARFWQLWRARQAGIDVRVQLARQHALSATPIDVTVTISGVRCGRNKVQIVQDIGVNLLEGLRAFLLTNSEKRTHARVLWPHSLQVCAVETDGTVGPPISCRGKDISMNGIGFYLPSEIPTSQVVICLPSSAQQKTLTVPATLVRAKRCADGWYDVGALFRLAALRKSLPEVCSAK
jgi:serine/threonine protein kinase